MSQHKVVPSEIRYLQDALNADYKNSNIRLREGEYQYDLAKTIAVFQLELYFPNVRDIAKKLYGEEKTEDIQFIRKIQTILKKMEKSNVVKILPKNKPWDLQRYVLTSFKFQDADKNTVVLATDEELKQVQSLLESVSDLQEQTLAGLSYIKVKASILVLIVIASYIAVVWNLMQPIVNPLIFISSFTVATACSLVLGKVLSQT